MWAEKKEKELTPVACIQRKLHPHKLSSNQSIFKRLG